MKLLNCFMLFVFFLISLVSSAAINSDGPSLVNKPQVEACDDLCVTTGHCNEDDCHVDLSTSSTSNDCGKFCVDEDGHCDEEGHKCTCKYYTRWSCGISTHQSD